MALKSNLPCPCGKSSDAFAEYTNGGHCFSCGRNFFHNKDRGGSYEIDTSPVLPEVPSVLGTSSRHSRRFDLSSLNRQFMDWRGVTKKTFEFFNAPVYTDSEGKPLYLAYPYGTITNVRNIHPTGREDKWDCQGDEAGGTLSGMERFSAGSAQAITICEGAHDGYSAFQMLGSKYPVVGVRSAGSALAECTKHRDYINSFPKIYLCFDNDDPGQKALHKVAKLFDFDKVWHVRLSKHNDVNEYLQAKDEGEFVKVWWAAKKIVPEGIVSSHQEVWDLISARQKDALANYPWPTLQEMTYGLFAGQFVIIKAPTKVGKTEFISHIEYEVLKNTDYNIGVIHIEDRKDITPKRYATYELGRTCHLPDSFATNEEIFEAYQKAVKRDGRVYYYSHFGSKDPDVILDTIRYLVTVCGCRFIFLDHITLVISGLADDDERRALDRIATSLATMTNDLDFCCVAITHVNDNGQSRGSRTIEHTAHTIITLARNKASEDDIERNTTKVSIEGNRICGLTGPAGTLYFNRDTWRLDEPKTLASDLERGLLDE